MTHQETLLQDFLKEKRSAFSPAQRGGRTKGEQIGIQSRIKYDAALYLALFYVTPAMVAELLNVDVQHVRVWRNEPAFKEQKELIISEFMDRVADVMVKREPKHESKDFDEISHYCDSWKSESWSKEHKYLVCPEFADSDSYSVQVRKQIIEWAASTYSPVLVLTALSIFSNRENIIDVERTVLIKWLVKCEKIMGKKRLTPADRIFVRITQMLASYLLSRERKLYAPPTKRLPPHKSNAPEKV